MNFKGSTEGGKVKSKQSLLDNDRLLVGVLGNRNSGKSHTWNTLFGRTVRTGGEPRRLTLRSGESVEVFLVSGSPEERELYVSHILRGQNCRVVLCSMQYIEQVKQTLAYFVDHRFSLFVQQLNPGFKDRRAIPDDLGIVNTILSSHSSVVSVRDGRCPANQRVQEMREFIYGWARYRDLIIRSG